MEYDLKQKSESTSKQINDLKYDNENLQNNLNEKISLNKKLYNDNNTLYKTLENKNTEIDSLINKINEQDDKLNKINQDNSNLEQNVFTLQDQKQSQKLRIDNLTIDLERLKKLNDDNQRLIKRLDTEKIELIAKLDEIRFELKNTIGKLKSKEDNLNFTQMQLDGANKNIVDLQNNISELDQQLTRNKLENNSLNSTLLKERNVRYDSEKNNEILQSYLKEKNNDIKKLYMEIDTLKIQNERLGMEKVKNLGEIDLYKNHVLTLSEANDKVIFLNIKYFYSYQEN